MEQIYENIECQGVVELKIQYQNGKEETRIIKNTVLRGGKMALVQILTKYTDNTLDYYIANMVFGQGGVDGGTVRYVPADRTGLYNQIPPSSGSVKPVIATINPDNPTQAVFTSVLTYDDCNGFAVNEMALVMANGTYYSMVTFGDLVKTNLMQITFNWRLSMV
jgi:hypothetical protein